MIILGVDPGLQSTGWGVIESHNNSFIFHANGQIKTDTKDSLTSRLTYIFHQISDVISSYKPSTAAIEQTYVNKNFGSSLKLSHARAAAMVAMGANNIDVTEYPSKTIKLAITSSGSADKLQMQKMLSFLMPNAKIMGHDAADALAAAVCHGLMVKTSAMYAKQVI